MNNKTIALALAMAMFVTAACFVAVAEDSVADGENIIYDKGFVIGTNVEGTAPAATVWTNEYEVADPGDIKVQGYYFAGWTDSDGSLYYPGQVIAEPQGNLTLTAKWVNETELKGSGQAEKGSVEYCELGLDNPYLELKTSASSVEDVYVYIDYTSATNYGERQGRFALSSEMTIKLNQFLMPGTHEIKIFSVLGGNAIATIPLYIYDTVDIELSVANTDSVVDASVFSGGVAFNPVSIKVRQGQSIAVDENSVTINGVTITAQPNVDDNGLYQSVFSSWTILGKDSDYDSYVPATIADPTIVANFEVTYIDLGLSVGQAVTNQTEMDLGSIATLAPAVDGTAADKTKVNAGASVAIDSDTKVVTITLTDNKTITLTPAANLNADKFTTTFVKWTVDMGETSADLSGGAIFTSSAQIIANYEIDLKPITVSIDFVDFGNNAEYSKSIGYTGIEDKHDWAYADEAGNDDAKKWSTQTSTVTKSFKTPYGSIVYIDDGELKIKGPRSTDAAVTVTATPADPTVNYTYTAAWMKKAAASDDYNEVLTDGERITEDVTFKVDFRSHESVYISINSAAYGSDGAKIANIITASNSAIKSGNDVTVKLTYSEAGNETTKYGYAYTFYKIAYVATVPESVDWSAQEGAPVAIAADNIVQVGPATFVIKGLNESTTVIVKATVLTGDTSLANFYIKSIVDTEITTVIEANDSSLVGTNEVRYNLSYSYTNAILDKVMYASMENEKIDGEQNLTVGGPVTLTSTLTVSDAKENTSPSVYSAQALYTTADGAELIGSTAWTNAGN